MSDAPDPQLVADRYRLISPLGQGGMGRVWKARDEVLHRDVAIKELVPPPGLTTDERREMRERSLREARAIARLNNINVVRIFDVLRTDGDPWIVMEYVASRSLQDTLAADGPVPPARAVEIGLGVLNALKAAHKAGIMHRDVKPGNVLLGDDGRVVLTDFGLATIPGDPNVTRTGMVLGSPAYISPERARDGTAGPEADLWGLGATLYAAVEGKSPYARSSAIATLAALATEPVPPPRNAGPLKQVLTGLLRKDPQERITAESAERMLRKASVRRTRGISLLDGVRRPGPNGPREPRPPLVPGPRPSGERPANPSAPVTPPAPRTPARSGLAAGAAAVGATATPAGADATAKVDASATGSDAAPTTKVDASATGSDAAPTTKVDAPDRAVSASKPDSPSADAAVAQAAGGRAAAGAKDATADSVDAADGEGAVAGGKAVAEGTNGPGRDKPSEQAGATSATAEQAAEASTAQLANAAAAQPAAGASGVTATAGTDRSAPDVAVTRVDSPVSRGDATPVVPERTSKLSSAPVSPARGSVFKAGQLRSERTRRAVLVGALVALLLVGLVVAVPLLTSGDGGEGETPQGGASPTEASSVAPTSEPATPAPTSAAPSPSASPTPSASPSPSETAGGLPEGWSMKTDPVGFKLPIPDGWRRSSSGSSVIYQDPNGVGELLIDRTNEPKQDAAAEWRRQEPNRKNLVRNYEFINIRSFECKWRTCADWDWLEDRDNTRIRTRNRAFVTASNRAFALRWEVANKDWDDELENFEMIFREFVPDRQD
ncbi:serine/threonine-protein kinase [Micromonospora endophytica]|uniref:non-specific serine/threonine protein kinase n=1 Tax=Micromonospora endophytica TaxID=515350 RepID=A0A2W2BZG6_9ACTN|nr:serine/threonine-protein kinase [Micromonospora endophytica]PZF92705.1 protein kinase [Micromonospora endophytica]RIW45474.1 serine/threonine protein kinase [Micromonospora endophytica]